MCRFFRHIVFGIESPHSLVYIGVWNKKKKEPNSPAGSFFL